MVHISQVGEWTKAKGPQPVAQRLALELAVRKALGPMISRRVETMTWTHGTLILHVSDPVWRRQLQSDLVRIRTCLSETLPQIERVILKT